MSSWVYNVVWMQGVLDKIRLKIQKLEKAIQAQREDCKEPCTTKCPIPVVSGKSRCVDAVLCCSVVSEFFKLFFLFPVWSGKECEDIYRRGGKDSQMYLIHPDPQSPPYKVFCDQTTQNGGEDETLQ